MTWQSADDFLRGSEDWDYEPDLDELIDPTPRKKLPFPAWHEFALCTDLDMTVEETEATFFGARDITERPAVSMSDIARAKAICADCPVFATCLATALGLEGDYRNEYGIWAGTSGRTRKRIWALVDDEGRDLQEIFEDILAGNLAAYERTLALVPTQGKVVPFDQEVTAA